MDYGTRNTIFQYNYSHDNAGGALLWCGCGDWRVKSLGLETGATFRYNVSVNDGYSTTIESDNGKSSEQSVRLTTLQGAVDGRFYNNTIVLPKERNSVPFSLTSDRKNCTNIDFANNLIIGDGSVNDESGKLTGASDQPHLNWTNNVYVGKDGGWPLAGKTADGATLTASVKDGYVQTATGEGDVKSTYVRTFPTDTTLTIASNGDKPQSLWR
ncbi:hypothetical protein [Bifidobacterium aesculapii]|uniref:hypothetical protein n=1 Tax=Bifidobacterium aesculapii TaxID=1329411 RepID=UPI0006E268D1|nr:hypothetical protein [Bifidobacterium aesculapii]